MNDLILTKSKITNITLDQNGRIFHVDICTDGIDYYTGRCIRKNIRSSFDFAYENRRGIFEKILMPYLLIDGYNRYNFDNLIGKDFMIVINIFTARNRFGNTIDYYYLESLVREDAISSFVNGGEK